MNKTRWIIFAVIVLAVFSLLIFTNQRNEVTFEGDATKVINEGPIADRVYGNEDQKVVLIEYGDFQCPACGSMFPAVRELKETYKDELTFVFRNLPLTNIHPNALASAVAAEAAGQQGKFYEMHDMLYENQQAWSSASVGDRTGIFEGYAQAIGLNMDQFKSDLSNKDVSQKIERDRATAKTLGATSTPTFVLNGQKLPEATATNADELKAAVEEALIEAGFKLDGTDN